ncbi:hypothetical protein EB1539851_23535 [Escherichia coli]
MKQSIVSLAQVIRSKNAGPYELVLDIGDAANLLI